MLEVKKMNESSKKIFEIIDEIRRGLGLSVSDVCGYELSERTYYRYLKGTTNVKHSNLLVILDKLGISFGQLFSFLFSLTANNSNNIKFTTRVVLSHFYDIEPYYQNYGYDSIADVDKTFFDCFYYLYKFFKEDIDKNELISHIEYADNHYSFTSLKDNRKIVIKTLLVVFKDSSEDISSLIDHYLHNEYKIFMIYFIISMGYFILFLMGKGESYEKDIKLLIDRYLSIYYNLEYIRATSFAALFRAYITSGKEREINLYNFFNFIRTEKTPKQDIDLIHFVEQLFNVKEKELIEKITLEDIINFKAI